MKNIAISVSTLAVCLSVSAPAYADNALTNMVRGVVGATEAAARGTLHGAEKVGKGAEALGRGVVRGTINGTEAVYHGTINGTEAALGATKNAVTGISGISANPPHNTQAQSTPPAPVKAGKPDYIPPPTGQAHPQLQGTTMTLVPPQTAAQKSSINVKVDGAGNIIDDQGKLVGRVAEASTDINGDLVSLAGRNLTVKVNAQGQMYDFRGNLVGHLLGAEPKITPVAPLAGLDGKRNLGTMADNDTGASVNPSRIAAPQAVAPAAVGTVAPPAASWTEQDALREAAPLLHGPIPQR